MDVTGGIVNIRNWIADSIKIMFISLVIALFTLPAFANVKVDRALCENKINPLGVNLNDIAFSWEISSTDRDVIQTTYHLVIASSSEKLISILVKSDSLESTSRS